MTPAAIDTATKAAALAETAGLGGRSSAVVVLGAGRSGTSAVARGVQALGVAFGDRLRRGGGKNPTGFFEDRDLLRLNKRLKRTLGIRGDSVTLIETQAWQTPAVAGLKADAAETIRRRFGGYPLWGYKYARTLRMLPFWEDVYRMLDLDVRYVVALRNPLSVARSRGKLDPRRGRQEKSDLEWLVNVVPYFREVRKRPFVVTDYDRLMDDPRGQLRRVALRLGLPVTEDVHASIEEYAKEFLRPRLRHSRFTREDVERHPDIHLLVREAYRWLDRLAGDEIGADSPELWEDWARIEREVASLAPILRHIDRVEADLRRARMNPMGPLQAVPALWRRLTRG
jgi:hypothetical protein